MAEIQRIDSIPALDELIERSKNQTVWVFKHSLTCGISSSAWAEFRRFATDSSSEDGTIYAIIEIQNARMVSNAFAERTGVRHQSPQAVLLREARVAWHASHYQINARSLKKA
jgi:bacillithiol system protein YtxJ